MRGLNNDELNFVRNQTDMLQGCINRMCVTRDIDEFNNMYENCIRRLDLIKGFTFKRFSESED